MNKITKLATIVMALVVSFFTNAKGEDGNHEKEYAKISASYSEPTGGTAVIRKSDDAKQEGGPLRFILSNSDTPGNWCISSISKGGEIVGFQFQEGPFKGQKYKIVFGENGKVELHEEEGRKTVWTKDKKK